MPFHSHRLTPPTSVRVNGFSVLEAIIVLAITGLALTLVFSIGSRASDTGFRLGRRALGVTDSQVAAESFRALIGGFALPPLEMPPDLSDGDSLVFRGDPRSISGDLIGYRATPCSSTGPQGRTMLTIGQSNGHTALLCSVNGGAPMLLADLGLRSARFSYSEDGSSFSDQWFVEGGQPVPAMLNPSSPVRRVFVRLSNDDGTVDFVAVASSGRPIPWSVFDPRVVL